MNSKTIGRQLLIDSKKNSNGKLPAGPEACRKIASKWKMISCWGLYPKVEKAGELQSQGAKGEAVIIYCEALTTKDLEFSGFPRG